MRTHLLLTSAALAVALVMPASADDTPKNGGTLTYMIAADSPPSLDGHREETYATVQAAAPYYSVLIRVNPENPSSTTDFVCDLCTEMPKPTDDGKTYAFKIRTGVKCQDDNPLTAQDVAASWNEITFPPEGVLSARGSNYRDLIEKIEAPDKANAFYWAAQNIKVRDDSKDYAALTMMNYIFGADPLSSRLAVRIRQKDGLSYGVQSDFRGQSLDSVSVFQEIAIYNPENVARLETAFGEELDRVLKDGFTQDELDKARTGWLQQNLQTRSSDAALVSKFTNQYITGRTMAFDAEFEKMVSALTVADVNAAVRKYIKPAKISSVEVGDFAKHPAKAAAIKP